MNIILIIIGIAIIVGFIIVLSKSDNSKKTNYKSSSSAHYTSHKNQTSYTSSNDSLTVVGGFYRDWEARNFIEKLSPEKEVYFLAEPENPYDRYAVMVISSTGLHLGYVPKSMAKTVFYRLADNKLKGTVISFPDKFQFKVKVDIVTDINIYNQAVAYYLNRKETSIKESFDLQKSQFFSELISQAISKYKRKHFTQVLEVLKPMIDSNAQSYDFFKIMIYTYHCLGDYQNESIYLDKILSLDNNRDKEFFDRRKYHILRVLGYITSNEQIENVKAGIETTILELDFFHRIVSILSDIVDPNRIDYRDSKGLFAINLDNNIRKPICKLYLNNPDKMFIGLMNEDNSVLKISINRIDELDGIKDELISPIKRYINDSPLFM